MSERVPLPSISGLVSAFVGIDLPAGHFATASRLVGFQPFVTDPPSGGDLTVELRTAIGGGGVGLSATILDGARAPAAPVTGSLEIPADTTLYMRVTAATGSSLGLYGQFLTDSEAGATAALTTLSRVKDYLGITDTDSDTVISRLISSVSLKMQTFMRRAIVAESVTAEKKSTGRNQFALVLDKYPSDESSVAVTVSDTVLDSADFDVEPASSIVYYTPSAGAPAPWPMGMRHISVAYDAGFASVPADIQDAATVQCAWEFRRINRLGNRTQVIDDNTATYLVDAWAPDVMPVLESHKSRMI